MGSNNTVFETVMGKHGLEEMSDNGELFADLCSFNKLVIGGSVFPHKKVHQVTWVSPHNWTENQIDHICVIEAQKVAVGCQSKERGRRSFRSPFHGKMPVETEELHYRPKEDKLQIKHRDAEGGGDKEQVPALHLEHNTRCWQVCRKMRNT